MYYTPLCAPTAADATAGDLAAQPEYYGLAAVHEIGTGDYLDVTNPGPANVHAYAIKHSNGTVTVVLDNFQDPSSYGATSLQLDLHGLGDDPGRVLHPFLHCGPPWCRHRSRSPGALARALHAEFGGSRYAPAPLLRSLAEAGLTGRKSGRGFYEYQEKSVPAAPAEGLISNAASPRTPGTVMVIENGAVTLAADLASAITAAGIRVVRHQVAEADLVIVAAEPTRRVLDAALACGRPAHVVGVHPVGQEAAGPRFAELIVTHLTAASAAAAAIALAAKLGVDVVTSRDRPGFLTAAVAYPQLNDAVRMIQDGYATPADIDTAMTLGCGYPRGPLQMLDDIGPAPVFDVLSAMHASSGDPAFAPAPLLAEYAAAGTLFRG